MADNDDIEDDEEDLDLDVEEGSSKKKLIIIIAAGVVVAISLTIAGTMFFLSSDEEAEQEATQEVAAEPERVRATYFPLKPPFIVNFTVEGRQRYLQVGISVMTRDRAVINTMGNNMPLLRNNLLLVISGQEFEQLQTDDGRERLKNLVLDEVQNLLLQEMGEESSGKVEKILFTSFVMQ